MKTELVGWCKSCTSMHWAIPEINGTPPIEELRIPKILFFLNEYRRVGNSQNFGSFLGISLGIPKKYKLWLGNSKFFAIPIF